MKSKSKVTSMIKRLNAELDQVPRIAGSKNEETGKGVVWMRGVYQTSNAKAWAMKMLAKDGIEWHLGTKENHSAASINNPHEKNNINQLLIYRKRPSGDNVIHGGKPSLECAPGSPGDPQHALGALVHCLRLEEIAATLATHLGEKQACELVGVIVNEARGLFADLINAGKDQFISKNYHIGRSFRRRRTNNSGRNEYRRVARLILEKIRQGNDIIHAMKETAKNEDLTPRKVRDLYRKAYLADPKTYPKPPGKGRPKKMTGR